MPAMYEVVLQFALAPRDVAQYDRVTRVEEELERPSLLYSLEGHDCTTGAMQIRLRTEDPQRTLEAVSDLVPRRCSYAAEVVAVA